MTRVSNLKIKPEHYEHLRAAVAALDTPQARAKYAAAGLTTKRYQWDLTYAAGLTTWVCDTLYKYLDDSHIQSALNRIVPPLQPQQTDTQPV